MGFGIQKFIAAFFMPLPMVFALGVLGLIFLYKRSYTKAKIFLLTSFGILAIISYEPFAKLYLYPLQKQYEKFDYTPTDVEYIFVLGNGHDDKSAIPLSSQLNYPAMKRLYEGLTLLKQYPEATLILSGYSGSKAKKSHAQVSFEVATALGVDKNSITLFHTPKNTATEAQKYYDLYGSDRVIVVTSATHMPRTVALFKKLGLNPYTAPTDFLTRDSVNWSGFSGDNIKKIEVATHEYLGLLWYRLRGYI